MQNRIGIAAAPASRQLLASLGDTLWAIYLGGVGVAGFAFTVSYTHIYDLGAAHGGSVLVDRMLPLSVDLLIVVASLVVLRQSRGPRPDTNLARWLPRGVMWAGIVATVAANVAYGIQFGIFGAVVWGWPGAAFVGVVEMIMITVRPAPQTGSQDYKPTAVTAGQPVIPASAYEAARIAHASSVAGGNALTEYQLHKRFGISRTEARKIVAPTAPELALNGAGAGA
jgi:hypothetical protein